MFRMIDVIRLGCVASLMALPVTGLAGESALKCNFKQGSAFLPGLLVSDGTKNDVVLLGTRGLDRATLYNERAIRAYVAEEFGLVSPFLEVSLRCGHQHEEGGNEAGPAPVTAVDPEPEPEPETQIFE